jgi:hypothetical protein
MWTVIRTVRGNSFWTDHVRDLISNVLKPRPWVKRVLTIAHNGKAFALVFVLNGLVNMKVLPEILVTNSQKIICLKVENVT